MINMCFWLKYDHFVANLDTISVLNKTYNKI